MKQAVVMPVLEPTTRLLELVDGLRDQGFSRFVVVDDGSSEASQGVFDALETDGAVVLHHPENLGKGMAIKTALCRLRRLFPDCTGFVTVDGDGQHHPQDVAAVCRRSDSEPDALVLGVRDFSGSDVPARSRLGNAFSAKFFKADTGVNCPDTQTGLRCVPLSLLKVAQETPGSRYEYEMNFLTRVAKSGRRIAMVPIRTIYEDNNAASHFHPVRDSILIYRQLLRYASSSLACSAIDLGLFAALCALLNLQTASLVLVATVVARLTSGAVNFTLNRQWSFSQSGSRTGSVRAQGARYAVLFCMLMMASAGLVAALSVLPLPLVVVKMIVDASLFVVSYFVQRHWVFAAPEVVVPRGVSQELSAEGSARAALQGTQAYGAGGSRVQRHLSERRAQLPGNTVGRHAVQR